MSQYYYNPFGNSGVNEESERAFLRKQQAVKEKKEIRRISWTMSIAIIAYLAIQLAGSLLLKKLNLVELYNSSCVFQNSYTIIAVSFLSVALPFGIMALVNKKKFAHPIIPNTPIKASAGMVWVAFGMLCCIAANVVVSLLISVMEEAFSVTFNKSELLEPDSVLACVVTCISTAVIPAICEEFAMRCCSLQLLRKYSKSFAVFAVSIVFGLLHGNVVQFIFAFIIGMVLGFVTVKTDSIVPAILIHAFNNGMSVVNSVVTYTSGKDIAESAILCVYGFWLITGVVSSVILCVKGEFKPNRNGVNGVLTNAQKFSAFLFPAMLAPFAILIIITATTIVKK